MKFHRNTSTIAIYFLFTLLWLALFLNASDKKETVITGLDDPVITPVKKITPNSLDYDMTPDLSSARSITEKFQKDSNSMDWFVNLSESDKTKAIQLLAQSIEHYGKFNEDVEKDMEEKFRINPNQTRQLYEHVYSKKTTLSSDVQIEMVAEERNLKPKTDTVVNIGTEGIDFQLHTHRSEIEKIVKEQGSHEKYRVEEGKPRTVPLFTTFDYREPKGHVDGILIELEENQAMNLYLFSELFKNMIDAPAQKDDNGYCQRTYGDNTVDYQHQMYDLKVDACKAIRSIDFSVNSTLIANVHSTHMKMIMEFVNKKDGVPPPEVGYIKEVTDSEIQIGDDMSTLGNFDLNFVNKIWDHNKRDVDYVLMAATYLKITCLSQLMGARLALGIRQDFDNLKTITLGYEFLKI